VEIHVLQGERELAMYNKTIGKFQLTGLPPAPRGMPQVEVTFDIDANGILHVSAKDRATGKEQKIKIEASSGISEQEIDRMVKDAESHASDDKQRREQVEARNRLDSMVYEVEKNKKEWEDKLDQSTRESLDQALDRARKALKQDDVGEVRSATEALQQAYSAAGAQIYAAQQAAGASSPDAGFSGGATAGAGFEGDATASAGARPQDDVVEADYEIVDDNK
jgi:molecular chaperone DnaK